MIRQQRQRIMNICYYCSSGSISTSIKNSSRSSSSSKHLNPTRNASAKITINTLLLLFDRIRLRQRTTTLSLYTSTTNNNNNLFIIRQYSTELYHNNRTNNTRSSSSTTTATTNDRCSSWGRYDLSSFCQQQQQQQLSHSSFIISHRLRSFSTTTDSDNDIDTASEDGSSDNHTTIQTNKSATSHVPVPRNIIKLQICNSPLDIQPQSSSSSSSAHDDDDAELIDAWFTMKAKFNIDDIHDTISEMVGDKKIDPNTIQYYNEINQTWEALCTEDDMHTIEQYKGGIVALKVRSTEYYDETLTSLEVIDDGMEKEPVPILPLKGYYTNPFTGRMEKKKKEVPAFNDDGTPKKVRRRRDMDGRLIYNEEEYQARIRKGYDAKKYLSIYAHDMYTSELENIIKDIVQNLQYKKYERVTDMSTTNGIPTMIHIPSNFTIPTKEYVLDYYMFDAKNKRDGIDAYYHSLLLNNVNVLDHIIDCIHYDIVWQMQYNPPVVEYDTPNEKGIRKNKHVQRKL